MRILLAHNSLYYPSYGGGDKSNRLLMEALAAAGHQVRVVTRVEAFGVEAHERLLADLAQHGVAIEKTGGPGVHMHRNGVDVRILTRNAHFRAFFAAQIDDFDPEVILTSTDDPGQLLLDVALKARCARVVYLVRATVAAPFGPDSAMPSAAKTAVLRHVDGAVGVSEYVADYTRTWAGIDAVHVPISLLPPGDPPLLGRFGNRFVGFVNPCAMKGIAVFTGLAARMPETAFAAIPSWGTTADDLRSLRAHANVTVLAPFEDFDDFLRDVSVMLVPSLWAEARSRVILEAMSRGIPVMASDVGGLAEAKLGVEYLLPVAPVKEYRGVDASMVPLADVPPQDLEPWERALRRLLTEREHYEDVAGRSRAAALAYARDLNVLPLQDYLERVVAAPRRPRVKRELTAEKKRLLALRLRQRQA